MSAPAGAPRVGWYGDDFTGATDTLAVLTQAGLRSMLFLGVPDAARRAAAARALGGELEAVGIAGASRSMTPVQMAAELAPVGAFFAGLRVPLVHYKVCSTFDSAPQTGSIGAALRSLQPYLPNPLVAIVAGQPSLGRYCAFSHLFAAAGRDGTVERNDRHPTMRNHPVTPMAESDLRRHLALQGLDPVAAVHYPMYREPVPVQEAALQAMRAARCAAVLLDVADEAHLEPVGRLLWREATRQPLLAVGPSSVAQALVAHWQAEGRGADHATPATAPLASATAPVLVFAGSLSPVTARQVEASHAFRRIPLDAADLLDAGAAEQAAARIAQALAAGHHVLACTAPLEGMRADTSRAGELAAAGARFVRRLLESQGRIGRPLRRVGIAGGDTSSLAVQALGLWGLSFRGTLGPGVAISRTHSDDPAFDGIELMLKGGQMGAPDVFGQLLGAGGR
jgi:uncharacterized protein YgbK (DUF1537 family)